MAYTTFNRNEFDTFKQPMFFGENVNVARYDIQKHKIFESLIEKQLSFFWRPEEVDLTNDRKDYIDLPEHEKHIFISNLKYQTLLDSVQGRSPNIALLPVVSLPELETWIETWSFSETIHSRSYTHIVRNIVPNPAEIFDDITKNEYIVRRAISGEAESRLPCCARRMAACMCMHMGRSAPSLPLRPSSPPHRSLSPSLARSLSVCVNTCVCTHAHAHAAPPAAAC